MKIFVALKTHSLRPTDFLAVVFGKAFCRLVFFYELFENSNDCLTRWNSKHGRSQNVGVGQHSRSSLLERIGFH